jgi:hypothetical protein
LRTNLSFEGSLGILEELYGMRAPHYPRATGICTKFIVRKSARQPRIDQADIRCRSVRHAAGHQGVLHRLRSRVVAILQGPASRSHARNSFMWRTARPIRWC